MEHRGSAGPGRRPSTGVPFSSNHDRNRPECIGGAKKKPEIRILGDIVQDQETLVLLADAGLLELGIQRDAMLPGINAGKSNLYGFPPILYE